MALEIYSHLRERTLSRHRGYVLPNTSLPPENLDWTGLRDASKKDALNEMLGYVLQDDGDPILVSEVGLFLNRYLEQLMPRKERTRFTKALIDKGLEIDKIEPSFHIDPRAEASIDGEWFRIGSGEDISAEAVGYHGEALDIFHKAYFTWSPPDKLHDLPKAVTGFIDGFVRLGNNFAEIARSSGQPLAAKTLAYSWNLLAHANMLVVHYPTPDLFETVMQAVDYAMGGVAFAPRHPLSDVGFDITGSDVDWFNNSHTNAVCRVVAYKILPEILESGEIPKGLDEVISETCRLDHNNIISRLGAAHPEAVIRGRQIMRG